jgi:uncharacterized UBP type Zn finger protein
MPQIPQFQPILPPKAKKKPKPQEACGYCGRHHEEMGVYVCLTCGEKTCTVHSLAGWTHDVIPLHSISRYSNQYSSVSQCGPAIRLEQNIVTHCRLLKVRA